MIVSHENKYSLLTHNGRHFNLIMTYSKGVFRCSQPFFCEEWSEVSFVPEEVIKKYKDLEISDLVQFWEESGHPLKIKYTKKNIERTD